MNQNYVTMSESIALELENKLIVGEKEIEKLPNNK